jgi:hypothetical protein
VGRGRESADAEIGGGWGRGRIGVDGGEQKGGGSAARHGRTEQTVDAYLRVLRSSRDLLWKCDHACLL